MKISFYKHASIGFSVVFTLFFLSSCSKENDLVSGYVIRDTMVTQNSNSELVVDKITLDNTTAAEKKKSVTFSR